MQREGGPIEEVRPGDVVWFPPGLKHWHGATPTTAKTDIALQVNGKNVEWMEKASEELWFDGLEVAFRHFGGVPEEVL